MRRHQRPAGLAAVFATAFAIALTPTAVAEPGPAPADQPEERPDPNKRVCRTLKVTGSHLRQRVCFKQREWDQMRENAQQALRDARPASGGGDTPQ